MEDENRWRYVRMLKDDASLPHVLNAVVAWYQERIGADQMRCLFRLDMADWSVNPSIVVIADRDKTILEVGPHPKMLMRLPEWAGESEQDLESLASAINEIEQRDNSPPTMGYGPWLCEEFNKRKASGDARNT